MYLNLDNHKPNGDFSLDGLYLRSDAAELGIDDRAVLGESIFQFVPYEQWQEIVQRLQQGSRVCGFPLEFVVPIGRVRELTDWQLKIVNKQPLIYAEATQVKVIDAIDEVMGVTAIADIYTDKLVNLGQNEMNENGVPPESFHTMRPSFDLSPQEYQILQWLSKAQEVETLNVQWRDRELTVQCGNRLQALRLSDALDMLVPTDMKWVKIYIGKQSLSCVSLDRLRGSTSSASKTMLTATIETMPSVWARQNLHVFQAIPGTVALLSTEPGHRFLALKPEISEGRLNKPISALINQPLQTMDEELWLPRKQAIDRVLETGENERYTYTHFWEGLRWHFQCTVAKASDSEIMTIVEDLDDPIAHWQKEWWRNRMSTVTA